MTDGIRRVVTGHDARGRSVIKKVDRINPAPIDSGDAYFALIWATKTVPADNSLDAEEPLPEAGKTLHGGSVIRVVDMLPGKASPMHRSFSLDYGIVLSGELELEMDSGETLQLKAGDIVVQRGTAHLWRNPSADQTCRIAFVLIEAKPVAIGERLLEEVQP
jgi:quercetin dioxygenase-like cupin family protein